MGTPVALVGCQVRLDRASPARVGEVRDGQVGLRSRSRTRFLGKKIMT